MGTWGTGPFDNDAAADLIAGLMKPVRSAVERKSDASASLFYNEARAAIALILTAHGTDVLGGPPLTECLAALVRIQADEVWKGYFRDTLTIDAALKREIRALKRKIATCEGCKKWRAKTEVRAARVATLRARVANRRNNRKAVQP
jgi:hypothetical protein